MKLKTPFLFEACTNLGPGLKPLMLDTGDRACCAVSAIRSSFYNDS